MRHRELAFKMFCDISVIIPNFNRTDLLERCLWSVAGQTMQPREVLLIDDRSTDENRKEINRIIAQFASSLNIRAFENETNRGANFCRNLGISEAVGEYLAFLDSDDVWHPKKLEKQLAAITVAERRDGKPVLSATGRYRVNGSGEIIARQIGKTEFTRDTILRSNIIGTLSSVVVQAKVARTVAFDESFRASQDWDFYIRLSEYVQYVAIPEPLCFYFDHESDQRITLNGRRRLDGHMQIYRKHHRQQGVEKAIIYNLLADDLQRINRHKIAAVYYAKWLAHARFKSVTARSAASCILGRVFSLLTPSSITERRYKKYESTLRKSLRSEELSAEVAKDLKLIKSLLSRNWKTF